ncbi:hypothetical protein CDAR_44081 [Caerostris darwini]|uniref:Uncharacterized protein n=1 Tax=Caerostris darwini TaxID=1538125 RepID=A0AAV4RRP7_9ARAC|nr:hypothetical protein CDAR_44081 [Caerostris darwini]
MLDFLHIDTRKSSDLNQQVGGSCSYLRRDTVCVEERPLKAMHCSQGPSCFFGRASFRRFRTRKSLGARPEGTHSPHRTALFVHSSLS